jgi:hypothetical protein
VKDSKTCDEVLLQFEEPRTCRALVLEDDGRVAYAYLLEHGEIVGDVWLYNVGPAPETDEWKSGTDGPFLNTRRFCSSEVVPRIREDSKVVCQWSDAGVVVTIDGIVMARLAPGARPGWSRLAAHPGPLAKPLEESP